VSDERGVALELCGVTKRFATQDGTVLAVDGVDLRAEAGAFTTVIGPSGCGKSTILNIVAGLEQPSEGEVRIDGREVVDRLGTSAYMPQHDALLPWRRVLDNTTLALELQGVRRRDARDRALPLLERFGLHHFVRAWPWQLSGGMRHRVGFLRTVISEPSLMMLDEPFTALDAITRSDLQQWLTQVWAEFGATVLLVTHDVAEAVFLSDRVYVMTPRPGRVSAVIDIDLPRPRTLEQQESEAFTSLERRLRHELHHGIVSAEEYVEPGK